jgi:hypothetical protein
VRGEGPGREAISFDGNFPRRINRLSADCACDQLVKLQNKADMGARIAGFFQRTPRDLQKHHSGPRELEERIDES